MTEKKNPAQESPKTWNLAIPDWEKIDTIWKRDIPFALWVVGEQELLFHWLDSAVDQNYAKVVLYVVDRPMLIRQAVSDAHLWPIEVEVRPIANVKKAEVEDIVDRLPYSVKLTHPPKDGWELIQHWFELEHAWLHFFSEETKDYGDTVSIGKYCEIASDTQFVKPYWIGDFVNIGPGCSIGPNVVIESGCIVAGNNVITEAHLGPNTYLGPEIDLVESAIHQNELISLKNKAYVRGLEALIADSLIHLKNKGRKPTLKERIIALRLWYKFKRYHTRCTSKFTDSNGREWPQLKSMNIKDRGPWLKLVIRGKLSLFGVTPRPESTLLALPDEWQKILKEAKPGAISYADVMGVCEVGSEEEALHCAYQATAQGALHQKVFKNWLEQLKNKDL